MSDFLSVCLSYLVVVALLGCSVALFSAAGRRCGLGDRMAAGCGIVGTGCVGYLGFFIYRLSVPAGTIASLAYLVLLLVFAWRALRGAPPRAFAQGEFARALALAALFGFAYLSLMFCTVVDYTVDIPALIHFEAPHPHDQKIPLMFAEAIFDRLPSRVGPDAWGWYFSERPPLQAGFVLLFSPLWSVAPRPIAYQALATALQASALAAVWLMCRTLGLRHRETLLAVVVTGASGFVYYNATYAWPKLLAATFVLVAVAPLARAFLTRERLDAKTSAIAAAAAALAMLAHGGAIYSLVPLALLLALRLARLFDLRALAAGAAVVVVLYGPWVAYGGLVDPNHGRLLKGHLTGGAPDSPEPFRRMLLRSYQEVTAGQWAQARLRNLERQLRDPVVDLLIVRLARGIRDARLQGAPLPEPGPGLATDKFRFDLVSLGAALRVDQRETAFRTLGVLNLAWPLLLYLLLRRTGLDPPLVFLLVLNVLTSALWSIVQFNGASTVITHASFAMVLIAFVSAAVILLRALDRWAWAVYAANIALAVMIWVVLAPGPYWSPQYNCGAFAAAAASAAAIAALTRAWLRRAPND
jgi:hypothetical protein